MVKNFTKRMTCFSLISSIEVDLRNFIEKSIISEKTKDFLPSDVRETARKRSINDSVLDADEYTLLNYIDFYDIVKVIRSNSKNQTILSEDNCDYICKELELLTAVRNRVCHSRPLDFDDLSQLLDFSLELIKVKGIEWDDLNYALSKIDDPSYSLSLNIPDFWSQTITSISNNLPLPEFDDTGFVGRKTDRKQILKLLKGNTRVITIVGEGGVGKTALAVRCLYDLVEASELSSTKSFDMILWVSLKTKALTTNGAIEIRESIKTVSKMFEAIAEEITPIKTADLNLILAEIFEYMEGFKILLAIDNLETLSSGEVRDFMAEIPEGSKVLITSRVGLGELEYRYKLDSLDENACVKLIRSLSELLNLGELKSLSQKKLLETVKILYCNPLIIKWYVLCLANGQDLKSLLNKNSHSFKDVLKFCFENLYDRFSEVELKILKTIACIRKEVTAIELRYLTDTEDEMEIEEALNSLHNSSMLKASLMDGSSSSSSSSKYILTDIASHFITKCRPIDPKFYGTVQTKKRELQFKLESHVVKRSSYKFDVFSIWWSNKDEKVCAMYLQKALKISRSSIQEAEENLSYAKRLLPNFSECYRIAGIIYKDDPYRASSEHETAIDYNPESTISRYCYAQFLIIQGDYEEALEQLEYALSIEGQHLTLLTSKALVIVRLGQLDKAIKLYETILIRLDEHSKVKWKISTVDQALEAYLRKFEELQKEKDYKSALQLIEKSISLFDNAFKNDLFDSDLIKKFERFFEKVVEFSAISRKIDPIEPLNQLILNSMQRLPYAMLTRLDSIIEKSKDSFDLANKWNEVSQNIKSYLQQMNRNLATVKTVCDGFGFLETDKGESLYFNIRDVNRPPLLEGNRVMFQYSENAQGKCAKKISLIK